MGRYEVWRLGEVGTPGFWLRQRAKRERALQRARFASRIRRWFGDTRSAAGAGWLLIVGSLSRIVLAVITVAVLKYLCALARLSPLGVGNPLFAETAEPLQPLVSSLVGAAVAVAATLLGLYYTTVGVIASTIYKAVPGDVRDLFIRERASETYLKVVILTISGGVVVLVAGALGYQVAGLTLVALGILAALTCVGLVVVTKRLFDYFDPSKLSAPLLKQISDGIRVATRSKTRTLPQRQAEAHLEVYRAVASYGNLVDMISNTSLRNATAPVALTRQLIAILNGYSTWKYTIPTDSNWWDRVPKHQNWLTIDHTHLHLWLNTSVGPPPELQPDYLWLEHSVARLLGRSLTVAFQSQAGANALSMSEAVANLVANLTARLQIDEALVVEAAWDGVVLEVTTTPAVAAVGADDYEVRLNQMAAAESLVMPLTQMLLGLSHAARQIVERDLSAEFEAALSNPEALYRGTLPTGTRQMLEGFSAAIRRERQVEGRRVTPGWWVDHLASRSLAEALLASEVGVLGAVRGRTMEQVVRFQEAGRADLAAVTGMASLELLHKIEFHEPAIRRAEDKLASFRNQNTSIDRWPERPTPPINAADEHAAMLEKLSELLPELRKAKFDPREPDLYGQLYQFVVDGAFQAILEGDKRRGLTMYAAALAEVDAARQRIVADLEEHDNTIRTIYSVEPIISAMDLAGYALLMHELDGDGIWTEVKAMWDGLVDGHTELAEFLLSCAKFVDTTFAMTVGGLERSRRSIQMDRVFESRGVGRQQRRFYRGHARDEHLPHPSPIVSALAPRDLGLRDDLYLLFVVEYLRHHLPADGALGRKADMLGAEIARYRAAAQGQDSEGLNDDE